MEAKCNVCHKNPAGLTGLCVPCLTGFAMEEARDETEAVRREMFAANNAEVASSTRADLEARHGQVWDTDELRRDFEVEGFAAPFVVVRRRNDGKRGSLEFGHSPRYYWGFAEA